MGEREGTQRRTNYHPGGLCSPHIQESLDVFIRLGLGGGVTYHLVATRDTYYPGNVGECRRGLYLLVVAQLVVQDDAVGLLRLRPRQGEAVHGGADLVHDGNNGGSCGTDEREGVS